MLSEIRFCDPGTWFIY